MHHMHAKILLRCCLDQWLCVLFHVRVVVTTLQGYCSMQVCCQNLHSVHCISDVQHPRQPCCLLLMCQEPTTTGIQHVVDSSDLHDGGLSQACQVGIQHLHIDSIAWSTCHVHYDNAAADWSVYQANICARHMMHTRLWAAAACMHCVFPHRRLLGLAKLVFGVIIY